MLTETSPALKHSLINPSPPKYVFILNEPGEVRWVAHYNDGTIGIFNEAEMDNIHLQNITGNWGMANG